MNTLHYSGNVLCPSAEHKEAADFMRQAKDVAHWNELREQVKQDYPIEILYWIESSGLIVKTLNA